MSGPAGGLLVSSAQLAQVAPHCNVAIFAPALSSAAAGRDISTPLRGAHWLAQIHTESQGFTRFEENLNYSAERLCQVWPRRFPTLAVAAPCAHNPEALAERVYGGRMGNLKPGDGWRYRGRGPGLTGRDNYTRFGVLIGVDLEAEPERAEEPDIFAKLAAAYWQVHGLNAPADRDDIEAVTESWNGGLIGLSDRKAALASYKHALGVPA